MLFKLETMTPIKAKKLLDQNTRNRRVRVYWVNRLVHVILNNQWVVTHQGIAIAPDGKIVDGQHRLMAIVKANKAVKVMVAYDVPENAVMAMDQGILRNVPDIAGPLAGFDSKITNHEVAVARQMVAGISSGAKVGRSVLVTNEEVLRFLLDHKEAIDFALGAVKHKQIQHSSIRAPIARAWYTEDRNRLAEFGNVMNSGMAVGDADRAAVTLRSWFLMNKIMFNGSQGRRLLYCKTETALRSFLRRRSLVKLAEAQEEYFPLPDEPIEDNDGSSSSVQTVSGDDTGGVHRSRHRHGEAWAARSDHNS